MSFDSLETSLAGGVPVELFEFRLGGEVFRYTTAEVAIVFNSNTYTPAAVSRGSYVVSQSERGNILQVTIEATNNLVRRFINSVPGQRCSLTVFKQHRGDSGFLQVAKGMVRSVAFTIDGTQATISVANMSAELDKMMPRFVYSSQCNNVLYDERCGVNPTLFRHSAVVTAESGTELTISGLSTKGSGWATAGFVSLPTGDYRLVLAHTGDVARLLIPFPATVVGTTVEVFAGCDHSATACTAKFSNSSNFNGYPAIPTRNPFQSGLI